MASFEEKGERSKNLPYKENPWNGIIPDSKEKKKQNLTKPVRSFIKQYLQTSKVGAWRIWNVWRYAYVWTISRWETIFMDL